MEEKSTLSKTTLLRPEEIDIIPRIVRIGCRGKSDGINPGNVTVKFSKYGRLKTTKTREKKTILKSKDFISYIDMFDEQLTPKNKRSSTNVSPWFGIDNMNSV